MFVSRSKDFHDFLSLCVVKSPEMRSSAADLLEVRNKLSIIGFCMDRMENTIKYNTI